MIDPNQAVFPVRVVLRRTGLTAELLRAWERRYGVVDPGRTPGGQRLYTDSDVSRLALLRRATLHGYPIGRVAKLPSDEIEQLVDDTPADSPPSGVTSAETAASARRAAIEAIQWMDSRALDTVLRRVAMASGPASFAELVVAPLVREVGDLWHAGKLRIVQEHLATTTIRQVLDSILAFAPARPDAPIFVAATTSGQHHELGAMLAATVAAAQGWRAVYLGPDLPGTEIGLAAARLRGGAIGLSFLYPTDNATIATDLEQLAEALGGRVPVYVGGGAVRHHPSVATHGFVMVDSLSKLSEHLALGTTAG